MFRLLWGLVALLVVVALGVGLWVWQGAGPGGLSEDIFDRETLDAAWMADPQQVDAGTSLGLKPGLRSAEVVVPNRPHELEEAPTPEMLERFKRRRQFSITTDERGLRRQDVGKGQSISEYEVPASGGRILCVGASISLGWGVSYEKSYPAILSDLLGVEVINAGAPAGEPSGLARWVEAQGGLLDSDLVIFLSRPDYPAPRPHQAFERAVGRMAEAVSPARLLVVRPPLSTFDTQQLALERLYPQVPDAVGADAELIKKTLGSVPVLELTPAFRTAAQRATGKPGETLVWLERAGSEHRLVRLPIRDIYRRASAPEVVADGMDGWIHPDAMAVAPELVQAFEEDLNLREPLFFDGGHPDAEGYALMAREVAHWVRQNGWVPGE
ncbi:MAG: hypothetical protein VX519_11445 [Myxococcota bacterium]|nr:hypothetical protein [Myxococcota bacterium]